jgi:hypothetical protein
MRSALALVLSLALTGALLAMNYALLKSHGGLPGLGDERKVTVTAKRAVRHLALPLAPLPTTNAPPFHWRALESPDYVLYAANLRAVGCPERTARDILLPDIEKLYDERERQLADDPADRFWETADQRDARQRGRDAKLRELELEKRALIRQLLGADWSFAALKELRSDGFASAVTEILLGFTDTAKSDHLFTIHQLVEDDVKAFQSATEGMYLDEDLPKLQALRDGFEAGLARGLAPADIEELRLRLAALANEGLEHLRRRDGVAVTGAELREIARMRAETKDLLAKALNLEEGLYSEELRAKADAAFAELLRRFLGAERSADAERAKDGLFRDLLQSTENRGVAKAALVQAYEARRAAQTQAGEIRADQQLSTEERSVLLAALRAQTAQTLSRTLGPAGFDAYLKQHGQQFTNALSLPVTRVQASPRTDVITVK